MMCEKMSFEKFHSKMQESFFSDEACRFIYDYYDKQDESTVFDVKEINGMWVEEHIVDIVNENDDVLEEFRYWLETDEEAKAIYESLMVKFIDNAVKLLRKDTPAIKTSENKILYMYEEDKEM